MLFDELKKDIKDGQPVNIFDELFSGDKPENPKKDKDLGIKEERVNKGLTLNEYQRYAGSTADYPNVGNNIYYPALGLGEAGEAQNEIKKIMRDDNGKITPARKEKIIKELGDNLWYIQQICTEIGISMEYLAMNNLLKLGLRQKNGTIHGSGDNR